MSDAPDDDYGLGLKVHEDAYRELERERDEWKAKYIQQNKALGCEMMDPAGTIWDYASATQRENVQLKREVESERALANEASATWRKMREERDAALIGHNECRATIEDARRALGATAHEGPLLAAMRITEQRDRLAEEVENLKASGIHTCHDQCKRPMCAMRRQRDRLAEAIRKHRDELELTSGDSVDRILWNVLDAVKGGSDE
jgi:hypothetical protein